MLFYNYIFFHNQQRLYMVIHTDDLNFQTVSKWKDRPELFFLNQIRWHESKNRKETRILFINCNQSRNLRIESCKWQFSYLIFRSDIFDCVSRRITEKFRQMIKVDFELWLKKTSPSTRLNHHREQNAFMRFSLLFLIQKLKR